MLKVVLDTNICVSGLISAHGAPARLFEAWRRQQFILVTDMDIVREIRRVLHYPRISRKYRLDGADIEAFVHLLEQEAVLLRHLPKIKAVKADPDDDKFLSCAAAAQADYIVSGDKHLLDLQNFKKIPIITAQEFLKLLVPHQSL